MATKILLVDDREFLRECTKATLATQKDFEIVGDAGTAPQIYALTESKQPDVVVMSHDLPGVSAVSATRELIRRDKRTRVLVLSSRSDDDLVHQALAAGARGFALLQQPGEEIFAAIRSVAQGHLYVAPQLQHVVVQDHLRLRRGELGAPGPCDGLSQREREVFELLVRGHSNQKISRLLCISPKTVETHRAHVLRKLGVHSIVDLVRFAARHQLPLE
jgi:DNA-binding NarL/FixJ family response regulator